jgi:hypothetical protein
MAVTILKIENLMEKDAAAILQKVETAMYLFGKIFKKNFKIRKFDIDEMWCFKFKNSTLVLERTDHKNKFNACLVKDFTRIFNCVKMCWANNYDIYDWIFNLSFHSTTYRGFALRLDKNKNSYYWTNRSGRIGRIQDRIIKMDNDDD